MTFCSECGKDNNKSAKYCGKCGEKLVIDKDMIDTPAILQPATSSKRLINLIIDTFVYTITGVVILIFFGLDTEEGSGQVWIYFIIFLYYFILELQFGKTLGKLITRTRVVSSDSKPLSAKQVVIRSISRFVPFEAFSFSGHTPEGWHDKWSRTIVVSDKN